MKGIRPYKPEAAGNLGLVDELWDTLERCWNEKQEERPDLEIVRDCLDKVALMWHSQHRPLILSDDGTSSYGSTVTAR